ncbi:DUF418 domain-containing protein [Epibacterium sp. MM17-32]|uniref:DUF418 domain-containing protein n=1 Tax=Epibacterium sp. MM17-32 TaxID=2917734 RepID=UPI001EF3E500|nr:DUF418 domain-containing protein [Epibacterium sp. MM17-32]MCG7627995.1 DUF418 domain-containing protein [Epibacterium sp. MM17-32]
MTRTGARLTGIDMARFLAYCGMVLVNFRLAAEVQPAADFPSLITNALEGRAAALFVVLAGVGLALGRPDAVTMVKRAAFLMGAGLLNLLIFEADILHFYALYFLCALPFLRASGPVIWGVIVALLIASVAIHAGLDYDQNWDWDSLEYTGFWTFPGFLMHSFFNGWHPVLPWLAFLLFGLWLGRLDLADRRVQLRMLGLGLLAAGLGAIPGQLVSDPELLPLFDTAMIPPGPTYLVAASGSAAAALGAVLLCAPMLERAGLGAWLTAPGRQALSLYIFHILFGMGLLEALGLLGGSLTTTEILIYSLGFCVLSAIYARVWALAFRHGPLEALMRWSTDRRRPA